MYQISYPFVKKNQTMKDKPGFFNLYFSSLNTLYPRSVPNKPYTISIRNRLTDMLKLRSMGPPEGSGFF